MDHRIDAKWEVFDYGSKALSDRGLAGLNTYQLSIVRGIIFGKHGRLFREQAIQDYLFTRDWYKASSKFTNTDLNDTERANLDKVRMTEAAKHPEIQPGDMRYWTNRRFGAKNVRSASVLDLHIMRSEIEAVHGKSFPDQPTLQKYFEDRYWYKANPKYNFSSLNAVERKNLAVLDKAERGKGSHGLRPADVPVYQAQLLPQGLLRKTPLQDLRLMRNAFYGLHGRDFRTPWISGFLYEQEWYKPNPHPTSLAPTEQKNVLMIVKEEKQRHEGLSSSILTASNLGTMNLEDVRNLKDEIYARHGKVFKTKWLQSYFASQTWYKPNPEYKESMLNRTEVRNAKFLARLQAKLEKEMSMEEG
jgi:hypothetical protein